MFILSIMVFQLVDVWCRFLEHGFYISVLLHIIRLIVGNYVLLASIKNTIISILSHLSNSVNFREGSKCIISSKQE